MRYVSGSPIGLFYLSPIPPWIKAAERGASVRKAVRKGSTGGYSHQLRTPLTSVMMILGLMCFSEYTKNGSGIGLAFAKKVITAQDRCLRASNVKPNGAEYTIRFYSTTKKQADVHLMKHLPVAFTRLS